MKYDFSSKRMIKIEGTPAEIKDWIKEISNFMDKGSSYTMMEKDVNNLERISTPFQYTFGMHHRIYFNHNSLTYVPNVSGKDAEKFHFTTFKKMFDKAKIEMDKKWLE